MVEGLPPGQTEVPATLYFRHRRWRTWPHTRINNLKGIARQGYGLGSARICFKPHVRPHEALKLRTPAQCWQPSPRKFERASSPFSYPDSSTVRRVREHGQITFEGRSFTGPASLAGEDIALEHVEADRYVVRYCATLIREIDLDRGASRALPFEPYQDLFEENPL